MSTASATSLPAQTIAEVVDDLIKSESLSVGARVTVTRCIVAEVRRRGFNPDEAIDGDALDTLVVDAIPAQLWLHA